MGIFIGIVLAIIILAALNKGSKDERIGKSNTLGKINNAMDRPIRAGIRIAKEKLNETLDNFNESEGSALVQCPYCKTYNKVYSNECGNDIECGKCSKYLPR